MYTYINLNDGIQSAHLRADTPAQIHFASGCQADFPVAVGRWQRY